MDSPPQRLQTGQTLSRLLRDERGLGTIELIVVLVLIVALSVSLWNFFGNDVACRFSDAIVSFDDAKRPAATQCVDAASSGSGAKSAGAAGSASGASKGSGTHGGATTGLGAAGGHGASGSTQAAATPTSAALPGAPPANGALPVAPSPSPAQPAPTSSGSPPREPSIGERIESTLAAAGRHAVDFTEGVVAGANPLTPLIPIELEPTFGNQVTFGAGQVVGSVVGLLDDAGNMIVGGSGMVASSAVLVLSNGTLVWVALPGFGASTALAGVGVAGAAGHGTNLMQGIDNMTNGENAPSRPSETSGGGSREKPPSEPPPKSEPPKGEPPSPDKPASNAAEHQRHLEQLREEAGHVDLVDAKARNHILNGDTSPSGHRGGNHQYPGGAGKSAFPRQWSSDRIIHEVSDVATDPGSIRSIGGNGNTVVKGTRDGIDITVIITPGGRIVTGFPTNVPRNP